MQIATLRIARLLGLAGVAAQAARFSDERFFLDDAWITFRTARNLVQEGQLTFDTSQPPVEGATNLLWTLGSALGQWLMPGVEPALLARLVGLISLGATVWVATGVAARLAGPDPDAEGADNPGGGLAALVTAILLGTAGNIAFHALGGLETGLYLLLWTLAVDAITRSGPLSPRLALVLAALGMTRPEGVMLGMLTLAIVHRRPGFWPVALGWGLAMAGMEGFRLATYGALVPNTFHAKPPDAWAGTRHLWNFLGATGGIGVIASIVGARTTPRMWPVMGIAALSALGVLWSGGDWMPGYRRLVDVYLVLALAVGIGVGRLDGWARRFLALATSAMVVASGAMALERADSGRYGSRIYGQIGEILAATPSVDTVAAADIGRLGWYFPGAIVDLGGLTDRTLARGWDPAYFAARDPDVILVIADAPVGPGLADPPGLRIYEAPALAWAREAGRYTLRAALPMPGGAVLSVVRRNDVDMPEATWGPMP